MGDAGEHIAPEAIGAQEEERAVLGRADEVEVHGDQSPELVLVASAEEAQRLHLLEIDGVLALQVLEVELEVEAIDEGADEAALVEQVHRLRREMDEVGMAGVRL